MDKANLFHWRIVLAEIIQVYRRQKIRATYPATDMTRKVAIFNINGGNYGLIVRIEFAGRRIYIKEFLTHAGYNREAWEKWL